ncbi:MAG: DegT/DnrJ/EryC1/StrS family aminotransferase [Elusimicrobia bacterium]|nr:DegT/DnrJ/EryC1/StrS family aminotransferase [Elusimicrobiota bacterium]
MKVPLSRPYVDEAMRRAVLSVLDSGKYILGEQCRLFEQEFAAFVGTREAVLTNSGTSAIFLSLVALGVKPGDEIIVPSLTAFPTVEPILHIGATPVFAEVDDWFTIDPTHVESLITPRTVGLIAVHLYGHPVQVSRLKAIAGRHHLFFLEDACQSHGALFNGRPCGGLGTVGCFSFYPSKNLMVGGDGGMVVTNDPQTADTVRRLRNHGRKTRYEHELIGYNLRFNEMQAAIGRIQLQHLQEFVQRRRQRAARYREWIADAPLLLPKEAPGATHAYHLFVVQTPERDALKAFLQDAGVSTEIHYPIPCHRQPALNNRFPSGLLPHTERVCQEILSLPMFPTLTDEELTYVCRSLQRFFEQQTATSAPTVLAACDASPKSSQKRDGHPHPHPLPSRERDQG